MKSAGDVFRAGQRPWQWGLRGDEPLWDELAQKLDRFPMPAKLSAFIALLETEFEASVGQTIEDCGDVFIERLDFGGMSGGAISGAFWRERAFPGLTQKFTAMLNDDKSCDDRYPRWIFNVDWENAEKHYHPSVNETLWSIGNGDLEVKVSLEQDMICIEQGDHYVILTGDGPSPARIIEAICEAIKCAYPSGIFGYPDMTKFGWQPQG